VLLRVEDVTRSQLRTDTGVWIEQLISAAPSADAAAAAGSEPTPGPRVAGPAENTPEAIAFRRRYGLEAGPAAAPAPPVAEAAPEGPRGRKPRGGAGAGGAVDTNEISSITITFRAVSLINASGQPDANKATAYAVLGQIKSSALFDPDPEQTRFEGEVGAEEPPGTFNFKVVAKLKRPLKL
jgi:hypothetical protein